MTIDTLVLLRSVIEKNLTTAFKYTFVTHIICDFQTNCLKFNSILKPSKKRRQKFTECEGVARLVVWREKRGLSHRKKAVGMSVTG